MWAPGTQRYVLGQRVLAFVHGASGAGFSSPVHGAEGLVPVVVQGADAPKLLDVRRVAASVVRAPGTRLPDATDGAVALDGVLGLIGAARGASASGGGTLPTVPILPTLPIPVRAHPPVVFPGAVRGAQSERGGKLPVGTGRPEFPSKGEWMQVQR